MKNRLRVLRAERRWTQEEVAKRSGVSRQTIIAIENDKYDPASRSRSRSLGSSRPASRTCSKTSERSQIL